MRFKEMQPIYKQLWETMKINPDAIPDESGQITKKDVDYVVDRIMKNKPHYEAVQKKTGLWWAVVACIHSLEAGLSFSGHLHNGDPLTARTTHVPAGRPKDGNPPFTWDESAIDAIKYEQASVANEIDFADTPEECLWYLENYNGWGYQTGSGRNTVPPQRSPYLWSGTNQYEHGKYTADGRFSSSVISAQVGGAAILKRMEERGFISFTPGSGMQSSDTVQDTPVTNTPPPIGQPQDKYFGYQPAPLPLGINRELGQGDEGKDVWVLNCALAGLGFAPANWMSSTPTTFGSLTLNAVRNAQQFLGLKVDGIVGPITTGALERRLAFVRGVQPSQPMQPTTTTSGQSSTNQRILNFGVVRANYNKVEDAVMDWYGTHTNACAAFASEFARQNGVAVPKSSYKGEPVSLVTLGLSNYLEEVLHWKRITKPEDLLPGDYIFSQDDPYWKGYPAHVYILAGQVKNGYAPVLDNRIDLGFMYSRNITVAGSRTPWKYALRAPV